MTAVDLAGFFEPKGVVVAGASSHPGKFGFVTLHNILAAGYPGRIFATNRQRESVLGVQTVASLAEVPAGVADLLIVCTPAATVPELLRQAQRIGITAAFVTSAGFGEADDAGRIAQTALVSLAADLGIALAGPNGQGVISTPARLCAQIVAPNPARGAISIASQSGNLLSSFLNLANQWGVGVARAISAGNAAALDVVDYVEWFGQDPETRVALAYIEGLSDGPDFLRRIRAVTAHKPVVVLKGGASETGARAAASHTGSLATNDRVFDGLVRQSGAVRAPSMGDAFAAAAAFATLPLPAGPRTIVLTTVGGWGVLTADTIARSSLELIELPADLQAAIDQHLPRWSRSNPIDLAGGEKRDTIPDVLGLVAGHPDVDAVILLGMGVQSNTARLMRSGPFYPDHGLERIVDFHERQDTRYVTAAMDVTEQTGTPVLVATELATADPANPAPATLRAAGWPCFTSADQAVRVLDQLWRYNRFQIRRAGASPTRSSTNTL